MRTEDLRAKAESHIVRPDAVSWINLIAMITYTAWKVSKYGVFSGANTGKYRPEKTPYLDTFHAVLNVNYLTKQELFHE